MSTRISTQSSTISNHAEAVYLVQTLQDAGNRLRSQARTVKLFTNRGPTGLSMFEELDQSQQDTLLSILRSSIHEISVYGVLLGQGVQEALDSIG